MTALACAHGYSGLPASQSLPKARPRRPGWSWAESTWRSGDGAGGPFVPQPSEHRPLKSCSCLFPGVSRRSSAQSSRGQGADSPGTRDRPPRPPGAGCVWIPSRPCAKGPSAQSRAFPHVMLFRNPWKGRGNWDLLGRRDDVQQQARVCPEPAEHLLLLPVKAGALHPRCVAGHPQSRQNTQPPMLSR